MGKRISAFLFDLIIWFTLVVGLAWAIFAIADYDKYAVGYEEVKEKYITQYEEEDGIGLGITAEEQEKLTAEEKEKYNEAMQKADEAFGKDPEARYNYTMMISVLMVAISLSILISYLILEFAIPLFLGNGQTFGKKIFGVAVMYVNGVKLNTVGLFVRIILGKYAVETMVPVMIIILVLLGEMGIVGTAALVLLLAFELGLIIMNKTRPLIHDALAHTVTVDMASQMIFDSEADMIAYKKRIHAEAVSNKRDY